MSPTTNEVTERLNLHAQQLRIRAGEIDPDGPHITVGAYTLHVGDEIATRHNDRILTTDRHEMVRNRAVWTIQHVSDDGSLTVTGKHGTVDLPAGYVAEHAELAYARTVMGAQGRNVHGGGTLFDKPTDVRNLYVVMSRGTGMNEAFIVTTGKQTPADAFAQAIGTDWIDLPAHARSAELRDEKPHRPGLLDGGNLRGLIEQRFAINERAYVTVAGECHALRLSSLRPLRPTMTVDPSWPATPRGRGRCPRRSMATNVAITAPANTRFAVTTRRT